MTSIFGFYFVINLLHQAGWPKRKGLFFGKLVIKTTILDSVILEMIDWASIIGALRPKLAMQVLATVFLDNDWEGNDKANLPSLIDKLKKEWGPASSPRDAVEVIAFSNIKKYLSLENLKEVQFALEKIFLESLIWGLCNSDKCKIYFENMHSQQKRNFELYKKAGLDIEYIPTLEQILTESETVFKNYENDVRQLSQIPKKLLKDFEALGIYKN